MIGRDHLLDVSRLVWRLWSGRLPTGIDRVCLEYLSHFAGRSQAVLQFRGHIFVLSPARSDDLFKLLAGGGRYFRSRLLMLGIGVLFDRQALTSPPKKGVAYINVGHTGLDERGLVRWISRNSIRAFYLVHDLIPITHPQYCRDGEAKKHVKRMKHALASATGIICNSQATLDQVIKFAGEHGLAMPPSIAAWIATFDLHCGEAAPVCPRTYFVTVGTIEGRKNHRLLLKVWEKLVATLGGTAPTLVIVGQRGWQAEEVIEILDSPGELRDHVLEVSDCRDEGLTCWLAGARALLMPSFVEGFGLPVVEALQLSTPVIASDLPVYREIAGDIPTYLDPADDEAWRTAITGFMGESPERERQMETIGGYQPPSWEGHFAQVESFLDDL